jgi:hypothetical protein
MENHILARPAQFSLVKPHAPALADKRPPPVGTTLMLARSHSLPLSVQWGQSVGPSCLRPRAHVLSLSRGPNPSARRVVPSASPFSLAAPWGLPVISAFPVNRRVPARTHAKNPDHVACPHTQLRFEHRPHPLSLLCFISRKLTLSRALPSSLALAGCNTPGVYNPLDNEYGFKHVISVDKTDAKF